MEKSKRVAKILMGVGALLTSVPMGLSIVSMLSSQEDALAKAFRLGWAVWVTFGLLPLGLALLFVGVGYLVKVQRQEKLLAESDEE